MSDRRQQTGDSNRRGSAPDQVGESHLEAYHIDRILLDHTVSEVSGDWQRWNQTSNAGIMFHHPIWLQRFCRDRTDDVSIFTIRQRDSLSGVVPFLLARWPLDLRLGEFHLGDIPLRRLRLQGGWPNLPQEAKLHDLLFSKLIDMIDQFDAIYFEGLEVGSFLWDYLADSAMIDRSFHRYIPRSPLPHPLIRMTGSFQDYMDGFSRKKRYNRLREVKILRAHSSVEAVRVTEPEAVDDFVDRIVAISRKTYQYNLLGRGIRDTQAWKAKLKFIAAQGWLRSYLLKCDADICSFIVGFQDQGRFYYDQIGYDPAWSKLSVGNVLLLLAIEDLYEHNTPAVFDLGSYGEHKQLFANETYPAADVFLFPRRLSTYLARTSHLLCTKVSCNLVAALDHLHLKSKIKRWIRRRSSAS